MTEGLFTSESVTEGHPDKVCDQISDAILDAVLEQDLDSRVACETATKTGMVFVLGEMTTKAHIDIPTVVRGVLTDIGYTKSEYGIHAGSAAVLVHMERQSPDIAQGVDVGSDKEQGAGDQGMMFGYATNETPELMPLPISLAHKLTQRLAFVRKEGEVLYLRPDGKSQVTVEYSDGVPKRLGTVVISTQHDDVAQELVRQSVLEQVIHPVCGEYVDEDTVIHINPTGKFVIGGPQADAGLTGRKIIVDTYGGMGKHGGGAFSGKDPSKVDRSAAYAARFIAKNVVAREFAARCEVQLAYAIGVAEPVSIAVDTFGTGSKSEGEIIGWIKDNCPTKPADIITYFDLKRPIYQKTASYGHFGREDFPWEKLI